MILEFFFDLASPYAYLGLVRMLSHEARTGCSVGWRPVDLEELKRSAGNIGPALRDLPAKLRYVQQDTRRWAARYGVPLAQPAGLASLRINRGTFFADDRGVASRYLQAAALRVWSEGGACEDESLLASLALDMGWEPQEFLHYTLSPAAADRQRKTLERAREAGVFGVPTIVVAGESWWGNDRLDFALAKPAADRRALGVPAHG